MAIRRENWYNINYMNFLNSTSSVIMLLSLSVLGLIIVPLVASLVLRLFSQLFKFLKNDFKTALYCNLIILGIFVGVSFVSNILFLGQKLTTIFIIPPYIISFIVGIYVVHRFYGSSILKSFLALFLTGLVLFIVFILVIILLFSPYLLIKH